MKENKMEAKIKRFEISEEKKLLTRLNKLFEVKDVISEGDAIGLDECYAVDPSHICLIEAKSEPAKRILSRFVDLSVRKPNLEYKADKTAESDYSVKYMKRIIDIFEVFYKKEERVSFKMGYEYPITFENSHFIVLCAPMLPE